MAGIFKAYDIRGTYPDQLDEATAVQIGRAFVKYLGCRRIVVTRTRVDPTTRNYITRRTAQGKTPREARRCLKRYIAREIYQNLPQAARSHPTADHPRQAA